MKMLEDWKINGPSLEKVTRNKSIVLLCFTPRTIYYLCSIDARGYLHMVIKYRDVHAVSKPSKFVKNQSISSVEGSFKLSNLRYGQEKSLSPNGSATFAPLLTSISVGYCSVLNGRTYLKVQVCLLILYKRIPPRESFYRWGRLLLLLLLTVE